MNNPTREVYENCKENIDNYLKNLKVKLPGNKIIFPFNEANNLNDINYKNLFVICLDILKTYSLQHKKLSNIFNKTKNILSDIFKLDKEIEIITDILGKYALEKGEFINMYKNKVMGIIRALILYKIIHICKSKEKIKLVFEKFLKIAEIINDQTGGRGIKYYNDDILQWTKKISTTDIEDYLIIPKFEPKDFLYLFLITYTEENENKNITIIPTKGFLFKNSSNKEIESLLYQALNMYDQQEINDTEFQNYIEKICRSLFKIILPDKCDENFDNLSYMDLTKKLELEKANIINKIQELKENKQSYEIEEVHYNIIKQILNCFTIATIYEQNYSESKNILTYDDKGFFNNTSWSDQLMSKYPGMTFWLSKYYSTFYLDLIGKKAEKNSFIYENNKISFWYFQIRVISNIQTFEYNCYRYKSIEINNKFINVGKILEEENLQNIVEEFIKDEITNLTKKNMPVNINWINLVLNDISPELKITNKNIRHFYEFFAILLADSNGNKKEFKNEIIIEYIIKLFDLIFKNKIADYFNKDINDTKDELIMLIKNPQNEILKKINEKKQYNLLKNEIKVNIEETIKIFEIIKMKVPEIIDNIEKIVKEKTKEYHNEYIKKKEIILKNLKDNIEQKFEKAKKKLQDCLNIIKNKELQKQDILEYKINELEKIITNKNYFKFSSKTEIFYYKLTINANLNQNYKYFIKIKNKIKNKNEKIDFDANCRYIYLQASIFDKRDIEDFSTFINLKNKQNKLNIREKIKIEEISINSFDKNMSYNQEVKTKMIKEAENSINIFEPKITFNGNEFKRDIFDNFLKLVKSFDIELLKKIDKYDDALRSKIIQIINSIDEQNLNTTNGKENDNNLENYVRNLNNYIKICKDKLLYNLRDITKVLSLNNKIKGDKIFIEYHNCQIALFKEPPNDLPIYISDYSYLKYPMISDNGKKITFSSKSFKMFLGSYIPSILSSPIVLKLLNIKENDIKGFINNCNMNGITVGKIDNENTLKIYIDIQNIKSEKSIFRKNIQFQLEISSDRYQKAIIPFELSLNVVPFSIIFSSLDYKLIYNSEKNVFIFNSDIVYANSEIKFSFDYLYNSKIKNQLNNNIVEFETSLESLENNDSQKPLLNTEENNLTIKIPKYEDDEDNIINFLLKIYFSSTFYINIIFNSKIYLFDFNFKWYSYDKKKFISDEIIIYIDKDKVPYDYKLYFKVEKKIYCRTEYKFDHRIPKEIEIKENNFNVKEAKSEYIFYITFSINGKINNSLYKDYYIEIIGNQVQKRIKINPINIKSKTNLLKNLMDLPKYKYSQENNKLIEIEYETEKDSIYITPFNIYIPYATNLYSSQNSSEIEPKFEPSFTSFIIGYDKKKCRFQKISFEKCNELKNYHYILGIFNDKNWYPIPKMENKYVDPITKKEIKNDDIFENLKYLNYEEEDNAENANKMINKIDSNNDYWNIPKIMKIYCKNFEEKPKTIINYINEFIDFLPTSIKEKLSKEKEILKKESIKNKFKIMVNNLIFILYNSFKEKYEQIQKNNNILYFIDISSETIETMKEIMKKKREEYFQIDNNNFINLKNESIIQNIENENKTEGYNKYLLHEDKKPEKAEDIIPIIIDEENIEMKEKETEKFDLSDISLIELKYPKSFTLNEIIEYYTNCNKITNILYFYIISASKNNNNTNQKIAGNYFQKLNSIEEQFDDMKNYTFFSLDINEFLIGFTNLIDKLNRIGCKLGKRIPKRTNLQGKENYIIFPKIKGIIQIKDNWNTDKNIRNNKFIQEQAQTGKMNVNKVKNEEYFLDENDSDSEKDNETYKNAKKSVLKEDIRIEKIKIVDIDENGFDNIYKDDDNESKSGDDEGPGEVDNDVKVGKINDTTVVVDPTNINEKNFKEEDGIKRALLVLEREKKNKDSNIMQKLDLGNPKNYHKFKNMNIFNIGKCDNLHIQQLYNKSSFLANTLFVKINGSGKVNYFDTLVYILLDPSVYISEEIKALNMFIVCAMTNALTCLEIKYSIVLMGDEEFRCVLKNHDEPHSIEVLERVYECLMIRRFRTNIPACLKYCLEELSSKSGFKYSSFFILTDGLDKSFICTQKNTWDINIFNKKNNSFGFIFPLSSILTKENKEFLNEIWNTFLNETKARSGVFIKSLELRIDEEFITKINDIFVHNLIRLKSEDSTNEIQYLKPLFKIKNENNISFVIKNYFNVLDDKSLFKLNGTYLKNDIILSSLNTYKEPLDINHYKNKLHQIAQKVRNNFDEQENNSINFANKFLSIRMNLNRGILEEIFKPNKANLKVLSNTGTEIDIMALILYFLNPVPDPMIYLQDAIGNVKEYAITVIIDTSFSVLNHININHSLNTIRVLLSSFTIIDLPSFDLIVTGEDGPIILCSEYPTFAALNEKSKLWELLIHCLANPISNADLISALQAAYDLKRMRTNNFPSFLFVLTDGLFDEEKQNKLKEIIAKLVQTNIQVIGIGLGVYPFGINNIFGQAIFDINPSNLLNSILSLLEGNINDKNEMNYIHRNEESEKSIKNEISKLIKNKKYFFENLRNELKQSPLTVNCYDMVNDEENAGYDKLGRPINPEGDKIGLLKENSLAGQKILIVMLWSCSLSEVENPLLDPKYINQTNESNTKCIGGVVDYLGVKVKTVLNYVDAITEITNKDSNGNCNYYTVWVMCGPDINKLPDNSEYPGLVEQFIDCLLLYWRNGGAVVLFCDNEPLYFQANMFLNKIKFNGAIPETKLRINGNDYGKNVLIGFEAKGNLTRNSIYDSSTIRLPNGTERMPLGRNIPQIYEGETISHSNSNNNQDIKPFIPFAKNSSGNICIMIYSTQGKEGDIIIDCGYTKVFINMSNGDIATWRYIQNITGFLARPEAHMIYDDGETAKNYRPKGVDFSINYSKLYKGLKSISYGNGELDIVYMIDSTGSMGGWISGVKNKCKEISDKLNENIKLRNYDIKYGGVFYRDPINEYSDKHEYQPLGNVYSLKNKMKYIDAYGGGDVPEDWVGGYRIVTNKNMMKWRENSLKIIIHIADAGAHGKRFSYGDRYDNQEKPLVNLIQECAFSNINIFAYQIGYHPQLSFSECKKIYDSVKSKDCYYEIYKFEHASDEVVASKLKENITNHISAFIAKK